MSIPYESWAVYRVLKDGREKYVPRTVTHSEKLAREIAADLTDGRVIMPDGSERRVKPWPHVARKVKVV